MSTFITQARGRNPLLMPELLQCILDCFPDHMSLNLERHGTLVSLAQTCRAISEPTLDRLWRELNSLYQLIRCARQVPYPFPWGDREPTSEEIEARLPPTPFDPDEMEEMIPPTSSEWDIIKKYSPRVWTLTINDEKNSFPFLKSIGSLSSPLFPNLRALSWGFSFSAVPGCIGLIYPLLSPTLVELDVELTEEDGEELRSFLQNYPSQCRNLKTLTLRFGHSDALSEETTRELSRAICTQEKLTRLTVVGIPMDATSLKQLAASGTIESLSLKHYPPKPLSDPYFPPEHTPFRHVTDLHLITSDLDSVAIFLAPRDQTFRTFRIYVEKHPTAQAISAVFSMLGSSSPNESLRQLNFAFASRDRWNHEPPTKEELETFCLLYESLLPLTSFSHLQKLYIFWERQVSLDDNELLNMARSWPRMQYLTIRCRRGVYPSQSIKYITFNGLLKLVQACPHLKEVCLPVDAREVPTDVNPDICNTSVESLHFPESPISDAGLVTEFLIKHFPSAERVNGVFSIHELYGPRGPTVSRYFRIWTEVKMRLRQFHPQSPSEW